MRRSAWLAGCTALLVACSGGSTGPSKEGGSAVDKAGSADESAGADAAGAGERGNTAAALGAPVMVVDDDGHEIVELTIGSITPDYPCNGDEATLQDPANGHFIGVEMTVAAQPGMAEYQNPFGVFTLTNNGLFTIIGADGVTETNAVVGNTPAYLCTTGYNELLTRTIEQGQTYDGVVVLDSANVSGTLIWQPVLRIDGPGPGWEWRY